MMFMSVITAVFPYEFWNFIKEKYNNCKAGCACLIPQSRMSHSQKDMAELEACFLLNSSAPLFAEIRLSAPPLLTQLFLLISLR